MYCDHTTLNTHPEPHQFWVLCPRNHDFGMAQISAKLCSYTIPAGNLKLKGIGDTLLTLSCKLLRLKEDIIEERVSLGNSLGAIDDYVDPG